MFIISYFLMMAINHALKKYDLDKNVLIKKINIGLFQFASFEHFFFFFGLVNILIGYRVKKKKKQYTFFIKIFFGEGMDPIQPLIYNGTPYFSYLIFKI